MCEVESSLNERPLTAVSSDSRDLEALTPNRLLLLRPGPTLPQECSQNTIVTHEEDGNRFNTGQTSFGNDGLPSIFPYCRKDRNGTLLVETLHKLILSVDTTTPRCSWLLAGIIDVYPDVKV